MPCYQSNSLPAGVATTGRTSYKTEADCLNACKEGACCEGTTCSVKPACQCQGTGQVFRGIGTTCASVVCGCCGNGESFSSSAVSVSVARTLDVVANSSCACQPFSNPPTVATQCVNQSVTFTQQGIGTSCRRTISGVTPDYGGVGGTLTLEHTASGCVLVANIGWALNPCGANTFTTYYLWQFSRTVTQYAASYFVFLFVNGRGGSQAVSTTTDSVPQAPSGFFYGGAKWSVTMSVQLA